MLKTSITLLLALFTIVSQAQNKAVAKTTKVPATTTKKAVSKGPVKASPSKTTVKKGAPASKVTFTINGKLVGFKYHLVVLNKFRSTEFLLLDSVTTDKDGNFKFQKTISEPCIAYIQHNKNAAVPLIIENGSVFNVTITASDNNLDYTVSGTNVEKSVRLYEFIKNHSTAYNNIGKLEGVIQAETDGNKMMEYQNQYAFMQKEITTNIEKEMNASGLEGYFILFNFMEEQKPADVKKVMEIMTPVEKSTSYYGDLKTFYDNNKALSVGEMAPDFALPTPDGDTLHLSDLRGKVVLIDFWASWCGPCRAEFPNVKRVYNRFGEKGFEILGVSLDKDANSWKQSIISMGLNWKHVSDLKYWSCVPAKMYKVSSIPATVLIDKDGRILAKNLRGEDLERALEELFQ